jgi:c-di-GMP-binding flagellar brake protein YcgR
MSYPYHVGVTLTIHPTNRDESEIYTTQIVYLTSQHICVELPVRVDGKRYGFFPDGTEINVSFIGRDKMYYQFISTVLARKKEDRPLMFIAHPDPASVERKQRRNYVRVPVQTKVFIYSQSEPNRDLVAQTIDLSGGGMAILLPTKAGLSEGDLVRWELTFPISDEMKTVGGLAQIKRIEPWKENDELNQYALEFTEIIEDDRQLIIQYCFNIQIERRGKRFSY